MTEVKQVNARQIKVDDFKIGEGGQAVVYEGKFYLTLYPFGTVKQAAIRYQHVDTQEHLNSIKRRMKHFNCPNLVEIFGYSQTQDNDSFHFYLAMSREQCSLDYLYNHMRICQEPFDVSGGGKLGWGWFYCIMKDVISGLLHLHGHNLAHTDVCPANIVVSRSGVCKIIDFQSLAVEGAEETTIRLGHEGWTDPDKHGKSLDIFGVGCLMCYLLTGAPNGEMNGQQAVVKLVKLIEDCKSGSVSIDHLLLRFEALFDSHGLNGVVKQNNVRYEDNVYQFIGYRTNAVDAALVGVLIPEDADGQRVTVTKRGNNTIEPMNVVIPYEPSVPVKNVQYFGIITAVVVGVLFALLSIGLTTIPQRDLSFLDGKQVTDNILAEEIPDFVKRRLDTNIQNVIRHSKDLLYLVETGKYVEALELSLNLTQQAQSAFLPYVCMPVDTYNQSEYIFGNPPDLTSVPITLNETWKMKGVDFMYWYREVLFQTQMDFFRSIEDGNVYMGTSDYNRWPKCYNPITKLYHVEQLRALNITWKHNERYKLVVGNLEKNLDTNFFSKQTLVSLLNNNQTEFYVSELFLDR